MIKVFIAYLVIINIITFILMISDKRRSKTNAQRTPEALLIFLSVIGGSVGVFLGMHLFRHKTKHARFYIGVPLILFVQLIITAIFILK